ncbi:hypothetical protein B7494_g6891 [Chlorociboria aeruginascens]|nr:hypothetical protein B7494_g6891 [Chlorociboria aeruginascens]
MSKERWNLELECPVHPKLSSSAPPLQLQQSQKTPAPLSASQRQGHDLRSPRLHIPAPDSTELSRLTINHDFITKSSAFPLKTPRQSQQLLVSVYSPDIERHVTAQDSMPDLDRNLRVCPVKTKLFGENHWMNYITQLDKICLYFFDNEKSGQSIQPSDLYVMNQKCKVLGRTIKSNSVPNWLSIPDFRKSVPSKEVCDRLVCHYLRAFESLRRILHIPSFQKEYDEYWESPHTTSDTFMIKFILVIAIGTTFVDDDDADKCSLRSTARQWIHFAQQWLSAPLEKSRMNLSGLQVQCLLILARETIGVGMDLVWISAGTLVRTAIQLGYHRDPRRFPGISILHAEMRRRLWATILDIGIQACLHSAMPPLISLHDFDTEPPLNVDDDEINKTTKTPPPSKPITTFTQTSLQIILLKSYGTRLEISRLTTDFHFEPSYDDILRLSSDLTNACRDSTNLTRLFSTHPQAPTSFQLNLMEVMIRRPLFSLHLSSLLKARTDPRYYFSRKACLDNALAFLSLAPSKEYTSLLRSGNGISRELCFMPAMSIAFELLMQLEEEALDPPSTMQLGRAKAGREQLLQSLKDTVTFMIERLKEVDVSVKGHLFAGMAVGQIEAMEKGEDAEKGIAGAAMRSMRQSYEILKKRASTLSSTDTLRNVMGDWDDDMNGHDSEDFDCDILQEQGMDFDLYSRGLLENWDDSPWP